MALCELWQSSIRIPDTVIVGKNGEIQWYLFYSKNTNSVLRKRSMSKTPQTLREAWGTQIKRPSQNAAPAAHLIARGGKAVVLRSTFDRICQDMQSQEECRAIIAAGNVRDGRSLDECGEESSAQDRLPRDMLSPGTHAIPNSQGSPLHHQTS